MVNILVKHLQAILPSNDGESSITGSSSNGRRRSSSVARKPEAMTQAPPSPATNWVSQIQLPEPIQRDSTGARQRRSSSVSTARSASSPVLLSTVSSVSPLRKRSSSTIARGQLKPFPGSSTSDTNQAVGGSSGEYSATNLLCQSSSSSNGICAPPCTCSPQQDEGRSGQAVLAPSGVKASPPVTAGHPNVTAPAASPSLSLSSTTSSSGSSATASFETPTASVFRADGTLTPSTQTPSPSRIDAGSQNPYSTTVPTFLRSSTLPPQLELTLASPLTKHSFSIAALPTSATSPYSSRPESSDWIPSHTRLPRLSLPTPSLVHQSSSSSIGSTNSEKSHTFTESPVSATASDHSTLYTPRRRSGSDPLRYNLRPGLSPASLAMARSDSSDSNATGEDAEDGLLHLAAAHIHASQFSGRGHPLTPLEERSPALSIESPSAIADNPTDPFAFVQPYNVEGATDTAEDDDVLASQPFGDESFYHALLELVRTEEGYADDLTDLVDVHFASLTYAKFITDEQRHIIVRDAARLLDLHRRLVTRLQRVDEDLGWIRDSDEIAFGDVNFTTIASRRFKSSDATVEDAARRISAIFVNEVPSIMEIYIPFCSAHVEALEVVKEAALNRYEWEMYEMQCTNQLVHRKSASGRLHFADFLIKPIQRICRYPLLFGNLLNFAATSTTESGCIDRITEAFDQLKMVATQVDEAQTERSLSIATVKVALRVDVQNHDIASLLNHLDQVLLIGSGHVIHTGPLSSNAPGAHTVKVAFFGILLYNSHVVMLRAKKSDVYEPKHWLPLRLFDMNRVPDGEGLLPYAVRLSYRDHTFEIGSLCHQEQELWAAGIAEASSRSRQSWLQKSADPAAPPQFDETTLCSEHFGGAPSATVDTASSGVFQSEFSIVSSDQTPPPAAPASAPVLTATLSEGDAGLAVRPKLSLKPPAYRVAIDMRLSDLMSASILAARAQSKRSHAMALHGPPPRSSSQPPKIARPHSFSSSSLSYRNILDSAMPSRSGSRRPSLSESDGRPTMKSMFSTASSGSSTATATPGQSPIDYSPRQASKLQRSRTSAQIFAIAPRSSKSSTISRMRRRATSLHPEDAPTGLIADLRTQHARQNSMPLMPPKGDEMTPVLQEPVDSTLSTSGANVARNSSTSSSSSCGSGSSNSHPGGTVETPQSSLPASPLLTPIDLETQTRWSKLGDAITMSLSRKRSFVSARPTLAVQPELAALDPGQLAQAQRAAEYIYNGISPSSRTPVVRHGHSSSLGNPSALSAHLTEHSYSFERSLWGGAASAPTSAAPRSQSQMSLPFSADKRQTSSGSLWSAFRSDSGISRSSSPAPSIYESSHEDDSGHGYASGPPSADRSPMSAIVKLADVAESETSAVQSASSSKVQQVPSLILPGCPSGGSTTGGNPMKRKNSITARLRAFRALGSSMTPLSKQTSRQ